MISLLLRMWATLLLLCYVRFFDSSTRLSSKSKLLYSCPSFNKTHHSYFNMLPRIWNCLPHMDANLSVASVLTLIKSYINFNSVYCGVLSSVSFYFLFFFWPALLPWPVLQCSSLTCFVLPNLFLFSLTCVSLLSICFLFCYCHSKVEINKYKGLSCDSCLTLILILMSMCTRSIWPVK